ncbi:hypothetical protein CHELA17_60304 [Chelatococcus asaccharovorans]|nr:hypothetical protein CHELA17_60304 [Chelatococcus asaccharovorans]
MRIIIQVLSAILAIAPVLRSGHGQRPVTFIIVRSPSQRVTIRKAGVCENRTSQKDLLRLALSVYHRSRGMPREAPFSGKTVAVSREAASASRSGHRLWPTGSSHTERSWNERRLPRGWAAGRRGGQLNFALAPLNGNFCLDPNRALY